MEGPDYFFLYYSQTLMQLQQQSNKLQSFIAYIPFFYKSWK